MEIIVSHAGADFDAYASMVAAQRLYPEAQLVSLGKPAPAVGEFLRLHRGLFPVLDASQVNPAGVSRMVLVDTADPQRLGPFRMLVQQAGIEVHVYDHHPISPQLIEGDVNVRHLWGAAVTVVLDRLRETQPEVRLEPAEATLFLLAIYEETGNLTFASTCPQDLRMAAWLLEQGGRLHLVGELLQQGLEEPQRALLERLLRQSKRLVLDGAEVLIGWAVLGAYLEELAVVVSHLLKQTEVDAVLVAVTMNARTYVVGRSRHPRFDVSPLLQSLGGGGHPCAASANLSAVEDLPGLLEPLARRLQVARITVGEHMTAEVSTLEAGHYTVAQALDELQRQHRSATVVVEGERPLGMVARSDLDRAISHRLGHAPVESVMTRPLLSVSPQSSLEEARDLLVRHDVGRLAVVQEERLVGIISRTDILRHWYQHSREEAPRAAPLLELPSAWLELLREAGQVAEGCGVEVFAVGGFVRDLYLGRLQSTSWDLDLCVEGSIDDFLSGLAGLWQASIHRHPRFETATLVRPDGQKVDVARARQEHYVRPAALPEVQGSNLKQDLYRRDFTINALALRLNPGHLGELVDFFGGLSDLNSGLIRILHNHSFIDDPTRMLRAVRLEQRLGFHLGASTEHLLRQSVRQGMLQQAGPDRIREELILCLSEPEAVAILERLQEFKVLASLHPDLALTGVVRSLLQQTKNALEVLSPYLEVAPWRAYVRAWLHRWKPEPLAELLRTYHFPLERGHRASSAGAAHVVWRLQRPQLPWSEVARWLRPLSAEEILLVWALNRNRSNQQPSALVEQRVLEYLQRLRQVEPLLRGDAILAAGVPAGPRVAELKEAGLAAQIDQGWQRVEQAQAWLRETLAGS